MFERYTEKARRAIFFARYEASQFGSPSIESEHLLLGLLRENKGLASRIAEERGRNLPGEPQAGRHGLPRQNQPLRPGRELPQWSMPNRHLQGWTAQKLLSLVVLDSSGPEQEADFLLGALSPGNNGPAIHRPGLFFQLLSGFLHE